MKKSKVIELIEELENLKNLLEEQEDMSALNNSDDPCDYAENDESMLFCKGLEVEALEKDIINMMKETVTEYELKPEKFKRKNKR